MLFQRDLLFERGALRFQREMLKTLEKACPLVIVPHSEVRLVFPFTDASSALNAPAIARDGGMLGILLFSAIPVWEPGPSGCFGGGIY